MGYQPPVSQSALIWLRNTNKKGYRELQDNITAEWDPNVVAKVLKPYVSELKIDTVRLTLTPIETTANTFFVQILTFDQKGVSSHPNHIALFAGAQTLIKNLGETSSKPPRLFTLFSAPLLTKYTSIVTVALGKADLYVYLFLTWVEDWIMLVLSHWYPEILTPEIPRHHDAAATPVFINGIGEYSTALLAMQAHSSQMEWFRWLYVAFSRYMWSNSWTHVEVPIEELAT